MALSHTPVPWEYDYRSTFQELVEVLLYAIVTGVLALSSLAVVAVAFAGREADLRQLVLTGPDQFPNDMRFEAGSWIVAYVAIALTLAEGIGNSQLLLRARALFASMFFPGGDWTHSTIWAWAIEQRTRPLSRSHRVGALVTMRSGEVYAGVLANYPVIADDKDKDFALEEARALNAATGQYEPLEKGTFLLLNSRDCRSVQVGALQTGPSPRPRLVQIVLGASPWILVVFVAGSALWVLLRHDSQDALLQLLEVFCLQVIMWPVLELVRGAVLRRLSADAVAERCWLFAQAALIFSATLLLLQGITPATLFSLVILFVFTVWTARELTSSHAMPPEIP